MSKALSDTKTPSSRFSPSRVFHSSTPERAHGWYFAAREGVFGPYPSKEACSSALDNFVARCLASGDSGGRERADAVPASLKSESGLSRLINRELALVPHGHETPIQKRFEMPDISLWRYARD